MPDCCIIGSEHRPVSSKNPPQANRGRRGSGDTGAKRRGQTRITKEEGSSGGDRTSNQIKKKERKAKNRQQGRPKGSGGKKRPPDFTG